MSSGKCQSGFTYLTALLLVAVTGFGLAAISEAWSHARLREKETELVWIGNQFRQAIALYYNRSSGPVGRYPPTLDDLIEDRRFPNPQRYLRRGLIKAPDGGIMGIYSTSTRAPVKTVHNERTGVTYTETAGYSGWAFVYAPLALKRR
jgi:type II secretory pathway pseudopilin PulG